MRASALDRLSAYGAAGTGAAVSLVGDPDPLVRALAVRGLAPLPLERRVPLAIPRLRDPIRGVRTEAGRQLAGVDRSGMAPDTLRALDAALSEYEATQRAERDVPSGNLNLALLAAARVELGEAQDQLDVILSEAGRAATDPVIFRLVQKRLLDDGELRMASDELGREEASPGPLVGSVGAKLLERRRHARARESARAGSRSLNHARQWAPRTGPRGLKHCAKYREFIHFAAQGRVPARPQERAPGV